MGIDATSGHIGMSSSTQFKNTASQIGGAAFEVARTGVTMGAGFAGGPAAANAANSVMSLARSAVPSGGNSVDNAIGNLTQQTQQGTEDFGNRAADATAKAQQNQNEMFLLQQAVNSQSQMFNTMTNVQKSKHDAAMAAIQNTR